VLRDSFAAGAGMPYADYVGSAGVDRRKDLAGLNLARVPAVFLEMGNMRNRTDAALMTDPAWRQQAAEGITAGVTAFLTST
jgi:N-acetylmuramoyl-L-alanine amidase